MVEGEGSKTLSTNSVTWLNLLFFFSSRRRHTRYWRDWSSDVCSSDLGQLDAREDRQRESGPEAAGGRHRGAGAGQGEHRQGGIGKESWRGRVEISGGAVSFKKKHINR